jgi:hypothetical protein
MMSDNSLALFKKSVTSGVFMSGPKPVTNQPNQSMPVLPKQNEGRIVKLEQPKQYWNDAKVKQGLFLLAGAVAAVAAIILTGLLVAKALPIVAAIILGIDVLPFLVIGAVAAFFAASQVKDYLDPTQLLIAQVEASKMSFTEVNNKFGLQTALEFKIVSKEQMIEKFNNETKGKTLLQISKTYNLANLEKFGIISKAHVQMIHTLKARYERAVADYQHHIETIVRNNDQISTQFRQQVESYYKNPDVACGVETTSATLSRANVVTDSATHGADVRCAGYIDGVRRKFADEAAQVLREYVLFRSVEALKSVRATA